MRHSRPRKFPQRSRELAPVEATGSEALLERVRRHLRRDEQRRALLTLQDACCRYSDDARVWALFAAQCRRMNRLEEADRAFSQALYLRERAHDAARARVLRHLLSELRSERPAA